MIQILKMYLRYNYVPVNPMKMKYKTVQINKNLLYQQ